MTVSEAVVSFALVAALVTLTPGLDTALVLRSAISQGPRAALATSAGIGTGVLGWGVAAAVGATAVLTASQTAFTVLRLAGAAYLIWLGTTMLWRALRRQGSAGGGAAGSAAVGAVPGRAGTSLIAAFRAGLLCNALNPKVGVFYLAMLPQFMPAGVPPALMGITLAGIHVGEGMLYFVVLIATAHRARAWLQRPGVVRATDVVTGSALFGVGLTMAVKQS